MDKCNGAWIFKISVMYDSKLTQSCPANRHNGWRRDGKLLIWQSNRHHHTV